MRRLPTEVKAARGTLRPGREAKNPPPRLHGVPKTPAKLKGEGLKFWHLMVKILASRHQLGLDSAPALTALCETYHQRAEFAKVLEEKGHFMTVTTTKGDVIQKAHPAAAAWKDADNRYRGWLLEFGLTDASRGKVDAVYIQPVPPPAPKPKKNAALKPGERFGLE